MTERRRKWWGWGYEDGGPDERLASHITMWLRDSLDLESFSPIVPPRLEDLWLPPSRIRLPRPLAEFCTGTTHDRVSHCYGQSFRDVIRAIRGDFQHPPDLVAYPRQEAEIVELLKFCAAEHVALIPFGGGTSVVGGVEPSGSSDYAAVITADMKHFNRILEVDTASRCARIQAGIYGPALEAGLKAYNYTLRHFPQSFEFSTLGGWIATRAGGHYATMYTHIDDAVESIRLLTPNGILETRRVPSSGAGPGPNRLILGSEGAFGFITEAWMRVQMIPAFKASAVIHFHETADGIQALKALSQSGLFPTNCRLISPLEALMTGLGDGRQTILILGFESHDHALDAWINRALAICAEYSGEWDANNVVIQSSAGRRESSPADQWRHSFLQAPYLRDYLVLSGLIVETIETAVTWDRFEPFHQKLVEVVQDAIATHCGRGFVTWRVTYVYPDGPVPYYTVIAQARRDHELEQWADIKAVASNLILENGGTITHHHAVGKDHRPWYEQERGDLFNKVLSGAKHTLDPNWIMNPEVLIPSFPPFTQRNFPKIGKQSSSHWATLFGKVLAMFNHILQKGAKS